MYLWIRESLKSGSFKPHKNPVQTVFPDRRIAKTSAGRYLMPGSSRSKGGFEGY